ncbi:hypothetical protein HW130_26120 [Streptomyces sp. PKU-EA00015]|uniref:hypothetical protein n=1 Tax=Streptomyces sp. PKU-EA00015 TaxID=2748326 RepID=UPI0015A3D3BB|nr:hypothetical protein [Streptomyces sp. PKU-EA00015]NWF29690.1 hypothetical protein [Streptomyces sp. PKU-EA00015]
MSSSTCVSTWSGEAATGHRRTARRALAAVVLAAAVSLTAACGNGPAGAEVPEGWPRLTTDSVTVAHPPAFKEQGAGKRSKFNAATATLEEGGRTVAMISVQLDYTNADSVEEAAIGAEAGIALGATLEGQEDLRVAGPEKARDAKRIDFTFTSTGERGTPAKGTRVAGVIVAGLDSGESAYAVRIDAAEGRLSPDELKKIIDSIAVE